MADKTVEEQLLDAQRLTNFILRAAFRNELEDLGHRVASDPIMAAVLAEVANGPLAAGDVKDRVAETTNASGSTLKRRIAEMETLGVLERLGSGPSVSYRSTGLVSVD